MRAGVSHVLISKRLASHRYNPHDGCNACHYYPRTALFVDVRLKRVQQGARPAGCRATVLWWGATAGVQWLLRRWQSIICACCTCPATCREGLWALSSVAGPACARDGLGARHMGPGPRGRWPGAETEVDS